VRVCVCEGTVRPVMDVEKPWRERRGARWLARAGAVVGCAVALGGGYAAAAGGLGSLTAFTTDLPGGINGYLPYGLAEGADGGLWFSAVSTNANSVLGRVGTDGSIRYFTTGLNSGSDPITMAGGVDGNVWFADVNYTNPAIGKITPDGTITEFATGAVGQPRALAAGLDGNLWFTGARQIDKITAAGAITAYPLGPNAVAGAIALGSDGAMWFTKLGPAAIGRITADGTITEYSNGLSPTSEPSAIVQGPDGNMWFVDRAAIGRITPSGQITEFPLPAGSTPDAIAAGADGNLWFSDLPAIQLGRITPDGTVTAFAASTTDLDYALALATGPDGDLWISGVSAAGVAEVVQLSLGAPAASIASPEITGSGQQGTAQSCDGARWSDWAGQQPSISAFAEDGYQWLLDGTAIPGQTAQFYTPTAGDVGHELSCKVTATYMVLMSTVSATSASLIVLPGATTTTTSGGGTGGGGTLTTTTTTPTPTITTATTTTTPAGPAPRKPTSSKTTAKIAIVTVATVHLDTKSPKLHVTLKASKACEAVLVLLAPNGKQLARWTVHLKAGSSKLTLALPAKVRHPGRDHLRVQTGAAKPTMITVLFRS